MDERHYLLILYYLIAMSAPLGGGERSEQGDIIL